jgi:hypothetical protein
VTAFIAVEFSLAGFPAWRPDAFTIVYIEIPAPAIHWDIIVPVSCNSAEFGIFIKGISAGSIGNE